MKKYCVGRVYKISNSVDDKLYIGSTSDTLSRRMCGHRMYCNNGCTSPVYNHMRTVGIANFNIVLLERMLDVTKEELRAKEDYYIKLLNTVNAGLNGKYEDGGICSHNKPRPFCKECGGSAICAHNKQRAFCKDCHGSALCIHNKQRAFCKECMGSGLCVHGKHKASCKVCNGPKYTCADCNKVYCSKYSLNAHIKRKHMAQVVAIEALP